MSFWEQHARAEEAHIEAERAKLPPSSQNAPAECATCRHVGADVLLGVCAACFDAWEGNR